MEDTILDSHDNNKSHFNDELFNKYAILLLVTIFLHTLVNQASGYLFDYFAMSRLQTVLSILGFNIVPNLLVAIIIYRDMKKLHWMSWPILLLTSLNSAAGAGIALGFFIYKRFRHQ